MNRYKPDDPRYHDRFQAAVDLLRFWRNTVQEDKEGNPTIDQLVRWTDSYLEHPMTPADGGK